VPTKKGIALRPDLIPELIRALEGEAVNVLEAMPDPLLFGNWFRTRESWSAWRVFLASLFALPIEDEKIYASCTGNRPLPPRQAREAYLIAGHRAGKSFVAALVAVFLAAFRI
jgi:hypothetical protein